MKHFYILSLIALMSMPSFAGNNVPLRRQLAKFAKQKAESVVSADGGNFSYFDLS